MHTRRPYAETGEQHSSKVRLKIACNDIPRLVPFRPATLEHVQHEQLKPRGRGGAHIAAIGYHHPALAFKRRWTTALT